MTIFLAGLFHTQVNLDCEPANFAAAFTLDEFAVGLVAAQTFLLSDDVIATTLRETIAGEDIKKVRHAIPVTMAIKAEECLTKCGKRSAMLDQFGAVYPEVIFNAGDLPTWTQPGYQI